MDLMQPEVATAERPDLQSRVVTQNQTAPSFTSSSGDVRLLSERGFSAIYGDRSADALRAFNADVAERGPGTALKQLEEAPGRYVPGVQASPTSRALAGSLRLSVPDADVRTDVRTDPRTDGVTPEVREVNGVSTSTPFPKEVGPAETQESVLRRTFEEYAFKAGISNERAPFADRSPREAFVEERMQSNREENNGEYRIFNPETQAAYGNEAVDGVPDWTDRQAAGTITMYPTSGDMEALEGARRQTSLDDGARSARTVLEALATDDRFSNDRLQQVMDYVGNRSNDPAFQSGFVHALQVKGVVQLSGRLAGDPARSETLSRALSAAVEQSKGMDAADNANGAANIAVAIAREADAATLARLSVHPLGTEFLVEASKRAMSLDGGWKRADESLRSGGKAGPQHVDQMTDEVLRRAAADPKAALELLQDPEFVRNAAYLNLRARAYSEDPGNVLASVLRSGTSAGMRDADPVRVATALRLVTETVGRLNATREDRDATLLSTGGDPLGRSLASALTEAYVANTGTFTDAAALYRGRDGQLDGTDIRSLMAAIKPYADVKDPRTGQAMEDRILAATAVEYTRLMNRAAETGSTADAAAAGNLAGAVVDSTSRANLAEAKAADERQEKLNQYISIAAEVVTAGRLKGAGDVVSDILGKVAAAESGPRLKGNRADRADAQNDAAYNRQMSTNTTAVLSAVERAETVNGASSAFVRDLRTYNDALPAGEKILDGSGRLVRTSDASDAQLSHMERLVNNSVPVGANSEEVRQAAARLSARVRPMMESVNVATGNQIKR